MLWIPTPLLLVQILGEYVPLFTSLNSEGIKYSTLHLISDQGRRFLKSTGDRTCATKIFWGFKCMVNKLVKVRVVVRG